jgi:hypothetical protein
MNENSLVAIAAVTRDPGDHAPAATLAENTQSTETWTQEIDVSCRKCGRTVKIEFYPFAPHPSVVRRRGVALAPYLREILEEELGPSPELVPADPPTHVDACSKCTKIKRPKEGETFKRRAYRGKFKTIGSKNKWDRTPEFHPDRNYDHVDQTLTEAYRGSRYGRGIDHANQQAQTAERLYEQEQLKHAKEVLTGQSLRVLERKLGIPRMTISRAAKSIQATTK